MYTLHTLTWGDTVKVSVILPDGQTTTLVCHRSRPPPPTTNSQSKCSTYSCSQVKTWMVHTRLLCQAGISGGSHVIFTCSHTHFHIQAVKYCIFLMLLLDECGTVWEQNWASPSQLVHGPVDKGRPYQRYVTTHICYWWDTSTWLVQQRMPH